MCTFTFKALRMLLVRITRFACPHNSKFAHFGTLFQKVIISENASI